MALRIVADALAEIPEGLREAAKQDGGAYVVTDLADGWALENVSGLRSALSTPMPLPYWPIQTAAQ